MKSLINNLGRLKNILIGVDPDLPVYHYQRPSRESLDRYVIWAEQVEVNSLMVGNRKAEQQIQGTIDLFTLTEFDPAVDGIQEALDAAEHVTWELTSVQYEDETAFIHYEWTFTVV